MRILLMGQCVSERSLWAKTLRSVSISNTNTVAAHSWTAGPCSLAFAFSQTSPPAVLRSLIPSSSFSDSVVSDSVPGVLSSVISYREAKSNTDTYKSWYMQPKEYLSHVTYPWLNL